MTKLKGLMAELNVANTYGTNVPPDKAGVQAGVDAICEGLALFVVDAEVDPTTISHSVCAPRPSALAPIHATRALAFGLPRRRAWQDAWMRHIEEGWVMTKQLKAHMRLLYRNYMTTAARLEGIAD